MAQKYKFYMSKDGENYVSLEDKYAGLLYAKCVGLEDVGKPKNKYSESYADAAELRVYDPAVVLHDETDITFTFLFVGDNRRSVYNDFCSYVESGKIYYYDTARYKKAYLTLFDAVKPSHDEFKGGTPYIQADFKFKNLWGKCVNVK